MVLAELKGAHPWLDDADAVVLDVLCKAKARLDMLDEYANAVIDGSVKPYPHENQPSTGIEAVPNHVFQQMSRESRTVIDAASKLGLTATDRARLFADAGLARFYGGDGLRAIGVQGRKLRQLRGRTD